MYIIVIFQVELDTLQVENATLEAKGNVYTFMLFRKNSISNK